MENQENQNQNRNMWTTKNIVIAIVAMLALLVGLSTCKDFPGSFGKDDDQEMDLYRSAGKDLNSAYKKQERAEKSREKYLDMADEFCSNQDQEGLGGCKKNVKCKNAKCSDCGDSNAGINGNGNVVVNVGSTPQTTKREVVYQTTTPKVVYVTPKVRKTKTTTAPSHIVSGPEVAPAPEPTPAVNPPKCKTCTCETTPLPANTGSYKRSELLQPNGCHGFKNPNGNGEDFRFANFEDMVTFWDANVSGKFSGYQRQF